jgi:hypothetical protein
MATAVVVVPAVPAVVRVVAATAGWVVEAEDEAEDAGAAVWSAVREVQPVTARAMTTAVVMIRTGRMVIPPNKHDPVVQTTA